jgi:hypothetical protein
VEEDVIGFEHGISFEFATPVAIGMLLGKQVIARLKDRGFDFRQIRINAAKSRCRWSCFQLRRTHANSNASGSTAMDVELFMECCYVFSQKDPFQENRRRLVLL